MRIFVILFLVIFISCKEKSIEAPAKIVKKESIKFLPFQNIDLDGLSDFKEASDNWQIVGNAYVDRSKDKSISFTEGTGILINQPEEGSRDNLFTNFEHGDIELELEVMMPKASNSGLYFQGRYEVQLFDSWGIDEPKHSDLGGIYQRWDDNRRGGKEGFEGAAPKINAAKSPGLWQHFKVIFHAPRFDDAGKKIENAWFEEVWLNGILIQENVPLSGPTRAAAFEDEKPTGPIMIQGDHGPVAIKNIKYKMYGDKKITLSDISMNTYENNAVQLPSFDSIVPISTIETDSISANMVGGDRAQRILKYVGKMNIPDAGQYLFDLKVNGAGAVLLIDQDTIVNLDGDYNLDSLGLGQISLQKGAIPFSLIYNKHRPWTKGFSLEVEGPGIQKYALHAPNSLDLSKDKPAENIMVKAIDEPVVQRSFLMHGGKKRTHCASVGTPQSIHYAYDLELGSLLKVWSGDFLDASPMWHGRGPKQLALPAGFTVSFHGTPEFAQLANESSGWPVGVTEKQDRKQLGYEFDKDRIPVFSYKVGNSTIADKMMPSKTLRMLHRSIEINGDREIWHKVAAGESVEKLPDGTFIVNDESYFIDFSGGGLDPIVRKSNGVDELLLKVPAGQQAIDYSIIW